MDRGELIQEMGRTRLVAVVRSKSAEEALATAKAVAQGGVQFIEITFSVPSALDVIEILVAEGCMWEREPSCPKRKRKKPLAPEPNSLFRHHWN